MRRADIEVPSLVVDVNSWTRLACYPQSSFYPLSHDLSTQRRGITKSYFRICSACLPFSQAPLCLYTQRSVTIRPEGTFERLRYHLGGDRPSQTARLPRSPHRFTVRVRVKTHSGWYFTVGSTKADALTSQPPSYPTQTAS